MRSLEEGLSDADRYFDVVLERPRMFVTDSVVQLETTLLNMLNYRCMLAGSECDPKETLRRLYRERYEDRLGSAGPSSKFRAKFGDDRALDQAEVLTFYRDFVRAVRSFSPSPEGP